MDNNLSILILDEDKVFFDTLEEILITNDYHCRRTNSSSEALALLKKSKIDLLIIDLSISNIDDLQLIKTFKEINSETEIIVAANFKDIKYAIEAIKNGAFAYFDKSNDPSELLLDLRKIEIINKYKHKVENLTHQHYFLESENEAFNRALDFASRAANSNSSILLLGESGVGKEVFANYIHNLSSRRSNAFVAVNCHAFSESLLQSELYGHEKGAFTGAYEKRIGKIEAADGGTLFLDEIGDTSLEVQLNLLRVLDNKKITRIGSNKLITIDFRLICATNKDIKKSIEEKNFRDDFYYRISTIVIKIPPLRERKEDLKKLINHFISLFAQELKKDIFHVEEEALEVLMNYNYPGNIRELKNIIERLVVLSTDGTIRFNDISDELNMKTLNPTNITLKAVRMAAERKHIVKILATNNYNMAQSADVLGISRRQLLNKINEYNIYKP